MVFSRKRRHTNRANQQRKTDISFKEFDPHLKANSNVLLKNKISQKELTLFFRQLATLTSVGIPLVQSFQVIENSISKPSLLRMIQAIKHGINSGNSLASTLRSQPQIFNNFFCSLIEIGELSGNLDRVLIRIVTYQEKMMSLNRKVRNSMAYPLCLLFMSFFITLFLLFAIVPTFQELYTSLTLKLPLITQSILNLGQYLATNGTRLSLMIFTFIVSFILFSRLFPSLTNYLKINGLQFIRRGCSTLPIIRHFYKINLMARFSNSLFIMQAAGIPIIQALESLTTTFQNHFFSKILQSIIVFLKQGNSLNKAMQRSNYFPPLMIQMIYLGEESGTLESLLEKITELYDQEFENGLLQLTTFVEPVMMILLGLWVGGILIALYLPMLTLGLPQGS